MYLAWLNIRLSHLTFPTEFMMGFSMNLGLGLSVVLYTKKGNIKQYIYILRIHVVYPLMWNLNIMNPNIVARITAKRRANWTTERFFLAKLLKTSAKDVIAASETYRRS